MPSDDEIAIRAAVSQWFDVLNAMLNGDAEPLAALYSHKARELRSPCGRPASSAKRTGPGG
jgi:hypothetical protein